jgi:hypothetical protein
MKNPARLVRPAAIPGMLRTLPLWMAALLLPNSPAWADTPSQPLEVTFLVSADRPNRDYPDLQLQVLGTFPMLAKTPVDGVSVDAEGKTASVFADSGERWRFKRVLRAGVWAYAMRIQREDRHTAGAHAVRVQFSGGNYVYKRTSWVAFEFMLDRSFDGGGRDAIFGSHPNSPQGSGSWTVYTGGRDKLVLEARSNTGDPGSEALLKKHPFTFDAPRNTWHKLVMAYHLDTDPANSEAGITAWLNGRKVADYRGPIGYALGLPDYGKHGPYNWQWIRGWDDAGPASREMLLRTSLAAEHPGGSLDDTEPRIRALLR